MTILQMSYSDLYPERRGHEVSPSVLQRATGAGHPHSLKTQCERNVAHCVLNMPMVQVQYSTVQYSTILYSTVLQHMLSALERAGCPVDLARHISCDMCQEGRGVEHAGGYDPALNQV